MGNNSSEKKKITLSGAQIKRMKSDICNEAMKKATLIYLTAMLDENNDEDMMLRVLDRAGRYAEYIKDHKARIGQVQEIIERRTTLKFDGFK